MVKNKSLIFKSVPARFPEPGKDIAVETREFDLDQTPASGGAIIKNLYASFDPYLRGRMRKATGKSYNAPFTIDQPIENWSISKILKSDTPKFKAGDLIVGPFPICEYAAIGKEIVDRDVTKVLDNPYSLDPMLFIGALGMPGRTAYSSFYEIGKPVKGETIFISAASGAVGQLVGQLAKHEGLKVIGSVGSDDKLDFILKELDFDAGFNYKKESAADALKRLAPNGIDIYYENVGGEQLQAAVDAMNTFGRIVACGMISQSSVPENERFGLTNVVLFVQKRLTMTGFIVSDPNMGPLYDKDHIANVSKWLHDGTFKAKMSVTEGIDNAPEGLVGMLQGKNFGKAVLKIGDE